MIVDTDKTASTILSIMNKQKMSGEVTFMPLNKLKYSEVEYPTNSVRSHNLITKWLLYYRTYRMSHQWLIN